jgi:hypothetical protein
MAYKTCPVSLCAANVVATGRYSRGQAQVATIPAHGDPTIGELVAEAHSDGVHHD